MRKGLVVVCGFIIATLLVLAVFSRNIELWLNGVDSLPYPKFPFTAVYANSLNKINTIKSDGQGHLLCPSENADSKLRQVNLLQDYVHCRGYFLYPQTKTYSEHSLPSSYPLADCYEPVFKKWYQKISPLGEKMIGGKKCRGWYTDGCRNSPLDNLLAITGYRIVMLEIAESDWFDEKTGILVERVRGKNTKSEVIQLLKEYLVQSPAHDLFEIPQDYKQVEL